MLTRDAREGFRRFAPDREDNGSAMQENVEHHADEEEDEMFPEANKNLSNEVLEELGARMEVRKESLKAETVA
jgi:hemerythrin-like domain-containing protein